MSGRFCGVLRAICVSTEINSLQNHCHEKKAPRPSRLYAVREYSFRAATHASDTQLLSL